MSQDIIITKKCRNCKPFLLQISALFSVLSRHFAQSGRLGHILYFSTVPSGFLRPLVFFSTSCLVTMTIWPQPMHFSLKSAPTRRISHSWLPQGCGFFSFTISPTSYTILKFPSLRPAVRTMYLTPADHAVLFYQKSAGLHADCITKNLTDRSADHKIGAAVHRCYGFIDQYKLISIIIIDQTCCRIYGQ